jgi:hypothetical protein
MSNNDFSIDREGNIVDNATQRTRTLTHRMEGGADIVTVDQDGERVSTSNLVPDGVKIEAQIRHDNGETIQIDSTGSHIIKSRSTTETPRMGHGPEGVLATARDLAGRACADLRQVAANPANYTMEFANTRASVQSLLQLGFLVIDGDGSFNLNSRAIMAAARNRG